MSNNELRERATPKHEEPYCTRNVAKEKLGKGSKACYKRPAKWIETETFAGYRCAEHESEVRENG